MEENKVIEGVAEQAAPEAKPAKKVSNEDFNWDAFEHDLDVYGMPKEEVEKKYDESLSNVQVGEVVEGTVVGITKREVIVNIGYKSEGIIPISEFRYNPELAVGEKVEVYVESAEDKKGPARAVAQESPSAQVVGSRKPGPRERRDNQGLHQVPHQGRYDRRRIRHRGLPAGFADRRENDPRLRYVRGQDHGIQGGQDQPGVPQRGRFAQGPHRGGARGPEEGDHVQTREGSDPRGYRQEHHLLRRIHRPGRRRRSDPHHRPQLGPCEPPRGDRQTRSETQCRYPRLRRCQEAYRTGSENS